MKPVLTNFITMTPSDLPALTDRFSVASISYRGWSEKEKESRFPHLATRIYKSGPVLALIKEGKESRFLVLLPKSENISLHDHTLSVKAEPLEQIPQWALRALLIRAIPRVLDPDAKPTRFDADGLYYVIRQKKFAAKWNVITTVRIDPTWSRIAKRWRLDIQTTTFTPVKMHENEQGQLPPKIAKLPRYELDSLGQEVRKGTSGEYVKRAPATKRKNRVSAIDLQGQPTLESYYQTRLGVLSMFLDDLKRAYGNTIDFSQESIHPDIHQRVKHQQVSDAYKKLNDQMRQHPIWVTNSSNDPEAGIRLTAELDRLGIQSELTNEIEENGLNILIVNAKDSYESRDVDPYQIARRQCPGAVIQSCYPERLHEEGKSHVAQVLIKELLIKMEVKERRLLLDYPELPADAWFITSIRPSTKSLQPKARWPMFYARRDHDRLVFDSLPDAVRDELWMDLDENRQKQVFEGYDRADLIYWPDTGKFIIAADTEAVCLPNEGQIHAWIKEMDAALTSGIPSELIAQYCADNPDSTLVPRLMEFGSNAQDTISARKLSDIDYKSLEKQNFHNFLADHGYRLKAPFASWELGVFQASTGTWINRESGMYSAGAVGSPARKQDNFNHVYIADAGNDTVPEWFWNSLDVWHVRHKGITAFPYIFKHLREYGERKAQLTD